MKATADGSLYCRTGAVVEGPAWCELACSQLEPAEVSVLLEVLLPGMAFASSEALPLSSGVGFGLSYHCDFTCLAFARCFLPALALAFGTTFFQSALEVGLTAD
jgi:hypothetical protein